MTQRAKTLPELDTPPANGVFLDWEEDRKRELLEDPKKLDEEAKEGNAQAAKVDPDDDFDNGL